MGELTPCPLSLKEREGGDEGFGCLHPLLEEWGNSPPAPYL